MSIPDPDVFSALKSSMMGARYLSALCVLLYDHCIHFDEEVTHIWSSLRKRTWLKFMFLCGRHAAEVLVIYTAAVMGGFSQHLTREDCKTYIIAVTLLVPISAVGTEGVIIYRLRSLWDRSRYATYLIGLMASSVLAMIVLATILELLEFPGFTDVASFLQSRQCLFIFPGQKPSFPFILEAAALVSWDLFSILIFTTNIFAIPYQCSYDVFSRFRRDGGRYFVCLFVRSMHLFMAILGKESRFSAIPFAWALGTIINSRIFHRIGRDLEARQEIPPGASFLTVD